MYKRHSGQISMLENPEMFGGLALNPKNEWIRLSHLVPWAEFEERYAKQFKSHTGQPACSARMALGSLLIKERNKFSDDDVVAHLAMNPYFQYFIGLQEYRYEAPFNASMMTRFRKRITPEMLTWVNDRIIERATEDKESKDDTVGGGDKGPDDSGDEKHSGIAPSTNTTQAENEGTLILDATCAPQNIRFPTDTSLLNEARENAEEIIDLLHTAGMTDGKKPRTYREKARKEYNAFSKSRKKPKKTIRRMTRKLLGYLKRDLVNVMWMKEKHPGCLVKVLPKQKLERLGVIIMLYNQQQEMYGSNTHRVEDRIVSLSQYWVRPIVRGKQNANVEFGAKVEMSVVNGFLRVEDMRWDAFNESITLKESAESYLRAYGHYPARILADTIFRTRENLRYCKECGIHMNGPRLGRKPTDDASYSEEKKLEWLESGERGEIERDFGVGKRRYSLDLIMTKLKHTSEVAVRLVVLTMNLWKKLRLLFALIFSLLKQLHTSAVGWPFSPIAMAVNEAM